MLIFVLTLVLSQMITTQELLYQWGVVLAIYKLTQVQESFHKYFKTS